jgi:4-hydroxy-tetrahydrodipicolinate synthase
MSSLLEQLTGTGVAIVTPFKVNGDIDYDALEKTINHVIDGGVEYIVILGTTGEVSTLDKQEKLSIIKYTYLKVNKRVPVVVGIGGNSTREQISDLQTYPLNEAVAVLSVSPYYSKPSQEGLFQHYKALAEASPKPILLYNVPARTGRNLDADTILRLATEVKNIAGIKEAGGDFAQCMRVLRDKPKDFLVVSGDDALAMPQIACGMKGVISVAANAYPKQLSEMVREALQFDFESAKLLNDKLIPAYELMFAENNPAGVKALMSVQGLVQNQLRLPVTPVSEQLFEKIKAFSI